MKKFLKKEKAITLISLIVAVTIMIIISALLVYNARTGLKVRKLNMMENDISILDDKVNAYYVKYGALPIEIKYNVSPLPFEDSLNPNDSPDGYYLLDLEAFEGLTLNYGSDFKNVTEENVADYNDLYIINEQSFQIYYAKGIEMDGVMYYTNDISEEIELVELPNIEELEVGDYVDYHPQTEETSYTVEAIYSGYTNDQTIHQDNMTWRILNINKEAKTVDVISTEPTSEQLSLFGALGYNNGVYLLNDLCKTLYSNSSKNAVGRSIKIEDIQDNMDLTVWDYHDSTTSIGKYGVTMTYSGLNIGGPTMYPWQWTQEKSETNKIDNEFVGGTLGRSEQNELTTNTYTQNSYGVDITVTQTGWNDYGDLEEINFKNSNVYELLLEGNPTYWIATRGFIPQTGSTGYFSLQAVKNGEVFCTYGYSDYLFPATEWIGDITLSTTFNSEQEVTRNIRPIVTIPFDKINLNIGDGSKESPWGIK